MGHRKTHLNGRASFTMEKKARFWAVTVDLGVRLTIELDLFYFESSEIANYLCEIEITTK